MRTSLAILIAIILALAVALAWRAHRMAESAQLALATLAAQRAELDAHIGTLERAVAATETTGAGSTHRGATAATPTPSAPKPPSDPSAALSCDPRLRALFRASFRSELALRYRSFYAANRLTPEQIRSFEELMTEAELAKLDLDGAAQAQGMKASDPSLRTLREHGAAQLRKALTDTLGEPAMARLEDFRRAEPAQRVVQDMAELVAYSSAPLTGDQADRLLATIAQASPRYRSGGRADLDTVDWPQVLVAAQPFLTPEQFTVLQGNASLQQVYALARQFFRRYPDASRGTGTP